MQICWSEMAHLSAIKMGLFWVKIKCFKSAIKLIFSAYCNFSLFGHSNEVLCIIVPSIGYEVIRCQSWRSEKDLGLKPGQHSSNANPAKGQNFFRPLTLTFGSFAVSWATIMHESHLKALILEKLLLA